jgi:hypothetical protein
MLLMGILTSMGAEKKYDDMRPQMLKKITGLIKTTALLISQYVG